MEEEIDIIELLKRVKEGKAPRKIQIGATIYELNGEPDELEETDIEYLYLSEMNERIWIDDMQPKITTQTKIKILDKPVIEELDTIIGDLEDPSHNEILILNWIRNNRIKINETIRHINKEEK